MSRRNAFVLRTDIYGHFNRFLPLYIISDTRKTISVAVYSDERKEKIVFFKLLVNLFDHETEH